MRNRGIWLVLLAGTNLYGTLIAPQSPLWLEQKSDLVVVGTGSEAVGRGNTLGFSLHIDRIIKGDEALAGVSVPAQWTSSWQAGNGGNPNANGIWFLQRTASGWKVLPVIQNTMDFNQAYYPAPAGPIISAYAYEQAASTEDKLAAEISSGIEASTGNVFQFYVMFESGLLDELKSPATRLLYQRLAKSALADKRRMGLGGLIREGDVAALNEAAQMAPNEGSVADGVLLSSIRDWFRSTDPGAVEALGNIAINSANQNAAFRESAAHAMAAIHSAAALPFLATLLDDADVNLRVEAVGGMGAFANGLAVQTQAGVPGLAYLQLPATAPYKTADTVAHFAMGRVIAANEGYYVSYWKYWWSQNRARLGY